MQQANTDNNVFAQLYYDLKNKVESIDLSKLSLDELKQLKAEAELCQTIYRNFELVVKKDANSLYGTSANQYFSLVDYNVATDITTSGKHFGIIVDRAINNFFKNWGEKELNKLREFYPNIKSIRQFTEYEPDTINDLCIYGDTDSRYLDIYMIYQLLDGVDFPPQSKEGDKELVDFTIFLMDNFINKIIEDTLNDDIDYRNANRGFMKMTHEVISRNAIFRKKKQYIMSLIWKDGKILHEPKLKFTGVEIKRGETSNRMKKIIQRLIDKIIIENVPEKEIKTEIFNLFKYIKFRREKSLIYRITSVSGLSEIRFDTEKDCYVSDKNHIQMQIALSWYNFIYKKHLEGDYQPPFEGQKMNFYYDINNNVIGVPDDVDIDKVPNLPEPDYNRMIKHILVKPILKYILDKTEVSDLDVEHFLTIKM